MEESGERIITQNIRRVLGALHEPDNEELTATREEKTSDIEERIEEKDKGENMNMSSEDNSENTTNAPITEIDEFILKAKGEIIDGVEVEIAVDDISENMNKHENDIVDIVGDITNSKQPEEDNQMKAFKSINFHEFPKYKILKILYSCTQLISDKYIYPENIREEYLILDLNTQTPKWREELTGEEDSSNLDITPRDDKHNEIAFRIGVIILRMLIGGTHHILLHQLEELTSHTHMFHTYTMEITKALGDMRRVWESEFENKAKEVCKRCLDADYNLRPNVPQLETILLYFEIIPLHELADIRSMLININHYMVLDKIAHNRCLLGSFYLLNADYHSAFHMLTWAERIYREGKEYGKWANSQLYHTLIRELDFVKGKLGNGGQLWVGLGNSGETHSLSHRESQLDISL